MSPDINRREFIKTCAAGASGLFTSTLLVRASAAASAKRPNILFIFTDDQREDTIAALGNPAIVTANLDRLVAKGTVFRNAYCMGGYSAAVCLPSRQMTLTGQSWFKVRDLTEESPNIAKTFRQAGYLTYHIGKRGNTARKVHPSFEISHYVQDVSPYRNEREILNAGQPGKIVADHAVEFLKQYRASGGQRPFFMYLAGPAPHDPRVAPQEYLDKYDVETIPLPPNYLAYHPFDNGEMTIRDEKLAPWPRTTAEIRRHLRDYYAVITYLDEQIGRIIDALKDTGQYDNTIIVFSSDQGIAIGSHGLMGKQNIYEHSMGVPLIFAGPGVPQGRVSEAFVYSFDVYPTLCDLAGVPRPEGIEGVSFANAVKDGTGQGREVIFLAYKNFQRALRKDNWKLIQYPQINHTQLFNLQDDPYETVNLAQHPEYADKVRDMLNLMKAQQRKFGDGIPLTAPNPEPADVDAAWFQRQK
ncbi:MAG: sulfatase-like hydrolase/transferase [Planctomycetota bacterium]